MTDGLRYPAGRPFTGLCAPDPLPPFPVLRAPRGRLRLCFLSQDYPPGPVGGGAAPKQGGRPRGMSRAPLDLREAPPPRGIFLGEHRVLTQTSRGVRRCWPSPRSMWASASRLWRR